MQRFFVIACVIGLFISGFGLSPTSAQEDTVTLTILNNSQEIICRVEIVPFAVAEITDSMIYRENIQPNQTQDYIIQPNHYNLSLIGCNEDYLEIRSNLDLTQSLTLTYPSPPSEAELQDALTIINNSDQTICVETVMPISARDVSETLVFADRIHPTEQQSFSLEPDIYAVGLGGCNGDFLELIPQIDITQPVTLTYPSTANQSTFTITNESEVQICGLSTRRDSDKSDFADYPQPIGFGETVTLEINSRHNTFSLYDCFSNVVYGQGYINLTLQLTNEHIQAYQLTQQGLATLQQGQLRPALNLFQNALPLWQALGENYGQAVSLNHMGLIMLEQGQFPEALDYFQQTLAIQQEQADSIGELSTLRNLGKLYFQSANYDLALEQFQLSLQIQNQADYLSLEARTLGDMATAYLEQGAFAESLEFYNRALLIEQNNGDQIAQGSTLNNLALAYEQQGLYPDALGYFQQALDIQQGIDDRVGMLMTLVNRASLYELQNNPAQAILDYQAAVDISEVVIGQAILNQTISDLAIQPHYTRPYQRLAVLLGPDDPALALQLAERGRAILVRNQLANAPIDFRAVADQQMLQYERELVAQLVTTQTLVYELPSDDPAWREAQQTLSNTRAEYQAHLEVMRQTGAYLEREFAFQTATLEQIQAVIPPDTTLLVYTLAQTEAYLENTQLPKSGVFLITSDSLNYLPLDTLESSQIDPVIRAFAANRQGNTEVFQQLYELLFAPLANEISTTNLIISPDDVLNGVPFAALQNPADGRYLVDDYAVSMIPSATALVLLNNRQELATPSESALVLSQKNGFPTLQNSDDEAIRMASILGTTPILDATETDLRSGFLGRDLIYISAYVELNNFAPVYSAIHLGADEINDGRFEIREIYELDLLQGTHLVVLSAYETGFGGNFALMNRAFLGAGAEQVITSLWRVDDVATTELLNAFFVARQNTNNGAEALRQAMLATRATYPDPYFWAGFTLSGQAILEVTTQFTSTDEPISLAFPPEGQFSIPRIEISPEQAHPGDTVQVLGDNYPPNSMVTLYLERPYLELKSEVLYTVQADENGHFELEFLIPQVWSDGTPITQKIISISGYVDSGGYWGMNYFVNDLGTDD